MHARAETCKLERFKGILTEESYTPSELSGNAVNIRVAVPDKSAGNLLRGSIEAGRHPHRQPTI